MFVFAGSIRERPLGTYGSNAWGRPPGTEETGFREYKDPLVSRFELGVPELVGKLRS